MSVEHVTSSHVGRSRLFRVVLKSVGSIPTLVEGLGFEPCKAAVSISQAPVAAVSQAHVHTFLKGVRPRLECHCFVSLSFFLPRSLLYVYCPSPSSLFPDEHFAKKFHSLMFLDDNLRTPWLISTSRAHSVQCIVLAALSSSPHDYPSLCSDFYFLRVLFEPTLQNFVFPHL